MHGHLGKIGKIAGKQAYGRIDDVIHERADKVGSGLTEDEPDPESDYAPAADEIDEVPHIVRMIIANGIW